jgi:hypothetical protein
MEGSRAMFSAQINAGGGEQVNILGETRAEPSDVVKVTLG